MAEPRECVRCGKVKIIAGRGLCKKCHTYEYHHGNIEKYPKQNKRREKRYDNCMDCDEYIHIFGRDRCKPCYQKWYISQPGWKEKHATRMRRERREKPEIYQAIEERRSKTRKRKVWSLIYNRQYYLRNAEQRRQEASQWRRDNPELRDEYKRRRRARENGLEDTLTIEEWEQILEEYNHACAYCGADEDELIREHWIPTINGGGYTADNIVPACPCCNSRKGAKTGDEFIEQLDIEEAYIIGELISKHAHTNDAAP
jgi:hypothetical protein